MSTKKFVFIVNNHWGGETKDTTRFRVVEFDTLDIIGSMSHKDNCSFYDIGACNCGVISNESAWKDAATFLYLNQLDFTSMLLAAIPYEEWGGEWVKEEDNIPHIKINGKEL